MFSTPRHGFPLPGVDQWRCSAAKAAAHALPRQFDKAGAALALTVQKDEAGKKVMMKVSKPRKPRKKEREAWEKIHGDAPHPTLWWEDQVLFQRLFDYCRQDILAEEALSHSLDDLSPQETIYYCLDQRMNQRGFQLDTEAVECALTLISNESSILNKELAALTNGAVRVATQRAKMMAWLATQGLHLDDTRGTTLDEWLLPDSVAALSAPARRAIEILRTLGRSSTAKYETMRDWAGPDGRVRGGLLYHGATTGRWSGAGVQPHNFPKGTIKHFDPEAAWTLLKTGDRSQILAQYPSVMEVLSCALRGAIVAAAGHQLYVADYASIEARVLLWLAGEQDALRLFREGGDLYCDMASSIYDRPITEQDKLERQVGKFAILGLGYQMGWSKFQATCATFGITIEDEFAQQVVEAYRQKYWRVKQLWYDTEAAACEAVTHKGHLIRHDRTAWQRMGRFLYCTLPSGRRLAYPEPELRKRQTPWGAEKWALTYKGVNTYTRQWERQTSYGGLLVENVVQAVSRDLMAAALQRCEESGVYTPVLSVHDEIIAEAPLGQGSVAEFEGLLMTVPTWAIGCPISAVGWRGLRYRK
jgi:DNA polymerase